MARRTILSPAQRATLFDPPDEAFTVERLYTLGPEDLAETVRRRRAPNRLGFAVQLSYQEEQMRRLRMHQADLRTAARQRGLNDLDRIAVAIVERDGKISIIQNEAA